MNTGKTILFGGAAVLLYSLFAKATAGRNLVFYPKGIHSIDFENGSPVLNVKLGVGNTTNHNFSIYSIAGDVYTNNTYIGYISNFSTVNIPARSESLIPIKIKLSLIGIVSQLVDGLTQGTWTQKIELDMKANVDNLVVPVVIKYQVGK